MSEMYQSHVQEVVQEVLHEVVQELLQEVVQEVLVLQEVVQEVCQEQSCAIANKKNQGTDVDKSLGMTWRSQNVFDEPDNHLKCV